MKRTLRMFLASLVALGMVTGAAAAASSPAVSTGPASNIKDTSAVLNGRVNPNSTLTKFWFVWGPTSAYGATGAMHNAGRGTAPVDVHLTATGLLPGTTYHFRLFAQNRYGTSAGADRTFQTSGHPLPGVVTGPAIAISTHGAILTGTVIPNGQATTWYFQYPCGPTLCQTGAGTVAASGSPVSVSQSIGGLAAGATFSYRLIGAHQGFPLSFGALQQFTTYPALRPYARLRLATTPRRASRKPFVFTTLGALVPSAAFPASPQCTGDVAIRYFVGKRQVAFRLAPVQSNCAVVAQVSFGHTFRIGGKRPKTERMRIEITFRGNGYLAPKPAHPEQVVLG